jgi:hypothetical protein
MEILHGRDVPYRYICKVCFYLSIGNPRWPSPKNKTNKKSKRYLYQIQYIGYVLNVCKLIYIPYANFGVYVY